jgi:hypothetical protein
VAIRLASVEELAAWAGDVDPTLAGLVLDGASATALRLATPVSDAWTSGDTVPAEVKGIILQVAARVAFNPTGLSTETVAGYSYGAGNVRGVVYTDQERQALLEAAGMLVDAAGDTFAVSLRPRYR